MKLTILMRTSACIIVVALSSLLLSCEGRAKIAFDHNGHYADDDDYNSSTEVEISTSIHSTSANYIKMYVNIDNYYDDQLYKTMSLKKCGIHYYKTTESDYYQKTINANLSGDFAYITLSNLPSKTSYYITPFVIDGNRPNYVYEGETIIVTTKGY